MNKLKKKLKSKLNLKAQGFTLIELVIALMLLTFLSVFTAQSIQKALQNKRKMQADIDRSARLRGTLSVMERDLRLALNHHDMGIELHNLAVNLTPSTTGATGTGTTGPGSSNPGTIGQGVTGPATSAPTGNPNFQAKKEVMLTQFIGEAEKLNFASKSLVRLDRDSHTSDVGEIGYFIKTCRSRLEANKSSECLWRRTSPIIDTEPLLGGTETPLLEDVKELKFRYLGPLKPEEWQDRWDSSTNGPAETRGILPFAVEITLEISEKTTGGAKNLRMTTVAAIHNPNNLEKKNDQTSTQTTPK